jgi:hypothetical protein
MVFMIGMAVVTLVGIDPLAMYNWAKSRPVGQLACQLAHWQILPAKHKYVI